MKLPRKKKERRMIELEMTKAIAVKFCTFISYRSAVLEKEINSFFLLLPGKFVLHDFYGI